MKKVIKIGFIDKKLERRAPFPLVASDKNSYLLDLDVSKYPDAKKVFIYAKRADDEIVCDNVDISKSKACYILKQGIYAVPGDLFVRLVLKDDSEAVLTAAEICFDVLEGLCEGAYAEDYETLEGFIEELGLMRETIGDIDAALDSIIEIQNSLMEVSKQ